MATNIKIEKKENENNSNLLRRFTRRFQESGIGPKVKSIKFEERIPSPLLKKTKKLRKINKKAEIEELIKLGKITERGAGRGGRRR
jgi:ribosomal protein S21